MSDYECTQAPDKIIKYSINSACVTHDKAYTKGGTQADRKKADIQLRKDINCILPFPLHFVGYIYYYAVRIFCRNDERFTK